MADGCKVTAGAGGGKGLEMALGSSIKGQLQGSHLFAPLIKHIRLIIPF